MALKKEQRVCEISYHGMQRVKERLKVNQAAAGHIIKNAWEKGLSAMELPTKRQREYVEGQRRLLFNGWTRLKIYHGYLLIFSGEANLITSYRLPDWFYEKQRFDRDKGHVRNLRKYIRMNPGVYF